MRANCHQQLLTPKLFWPWGELLHKMILAGFSVQLPVQFIIVFSRSVLVQKFRNMNVEYHISTNNVTAKNSNEMSFRSKKKGKCGYLPFPRNRANLVNLLVPHSKRASNSWCFAQEVAKNGQLDQESYLGKNFTPFVSKQTFQGKLFSYFDVSLFSVFEKYMSSPRPRSIITIIACAQ